jgi:LPXTG-motif cell wall-anchored protein
VVATSVPGKVTVTWDPPALPTGRGVIGYQADILSVQERPNAGNICQPPLGERVCVATDVLPGEEFEVQVGAFDEYGQPGVASEFIRVTVPFPVPATVPASHGVLTPDAGSSDKVVAGKTVVVKGTGYRPGSTVQILMYSEPQVLTSVVADGGGNFTVTVTVPAGLAPGQHTLVASGVDLSGNARYTTLPVTVSKEGVATVASRRLAATGADVTVPAIAGIAALAVGAGLIGASRRRSAV